MQDVLKYIKTSLSELYTSSEITFLSRILIEDVLGMPYLVVIGNKNTKITADQHRRLELLVDQLKQGEPIQYVLGKSEFYGLDFTVDKRVLIPRPETEELVETIINDHKNKAPLSILDIGTGSGCIAISLKKHLSQASVSAWDVSRDALSVAKKNANNLQTDVLFSEVDVLGDYPKGKKFDVIVSNPPYVLDSEKQNMEGNVLKYEPHLALFVPDDKALLFYERIADIAKDILLEGGFLYFEINAAKGKDTIEMFQKRGFQDVVLIKDISGNDRMVKACLR